MNHHALLSRLAQKNGRKIVLLILDGLGDLRTEAQPKSALEKARTPNLDALAARSSLGRLVPVAQGVTPGSGPAHLGLFGYDPTDEQADIGRGVLEALGLELQVPPGTIAARGNFASIDQEGNLTDRRAGRIPSAEGARLCKHLQGVLDDEREFLSERSGGLSVEIHPGEGYRFVLLVRDTTDGQLGHFLSDTDPQRTGVPVKPLAPNPLANPNDHKEASESARRLQPILDRMVRALADEPQANSFSLRGFSKMPELPSFADLYKLKAGCFAGYPLYRGVASACGMQVVPCEKRIASIIETTKEHWDDYDYFFLHVKQTDQAGEDGDLDTKVAVIEEVDAALPALLELEPDVLAITGDHSTPVPMKAHSWHPIPLLLFSEGGFIDQTTRFDELEAAVGHVGTIRSWELMGLLLGNAGKLAKYGA